MYHCVSEVHCQTAIVSESLTEHSHLMYHCVSEIHCRTAIVSESFTEHNHNVSSVSEVH